MMRGRRRFSDGGCPRLGLTTAEVVAIAASLGLVAATAFIASPYVIKAGPDSERQPVPREHWPENLVDAVDAMTLLIQSARATLYVDHVESGEPKPIEFIVLWGVDRVEPGRINRSEVVIVRHSRLLQSISAYVYAPGEFDAGDEYLDQSSFDRSFIDEFMRDGSTVQRVIGIEINVMAFRELRASDHSDQSIPRNSPGAIQLTCMPHSADTQVAASVPVALPSWYESR